MAATEDLIDVSTLLGPIGLKQYRESLMTNLWGGDGRGLSRRKLAQVRIHHLPDMNITRHDHQKVIMSRLRQLDRIPAMSPDDVPESDFTSDMHSSHVPLHHATSNSSTLQSTTRNSGGGGRQLVRRSSTSSESTNESGGNGAQGQAQAPGKRTRKGSGAGQTWAAIHTARQQLDKSSKAKKIEQMRRGSQVMSVDPATGVPRRPKESIGGATPDLTKSMPRRATLRMNSMPDGTATDARARAVEYGNQALRSNTLENQLKELKRTVLQQLCDTMACERATLMFLDAVNEELFFYDGDTCIRFPMTKGLAGHCAMTGERLLVNDPYADPRFNQTIDKETGFVTRNMLCEPVRSRMGGRVLAVLQMVNKRRGEGFTEQDSEVMEMAVLRVSEALENKFRELVTHQAEWGGSTRRRRSSTGNAGPRYLDHLKPEAVLAQELSDMQNGANGSSSSSGPTGRRMSMHSSVDAAEAAKARRRRDYADNVRQSGVGLQ